MGLIHQDRERKSFLHEDEQINIDSNYNLVDADILTF